MQALPICFPTGPAAQHPLRHFSWLVERLGRLPWARLDSEDMAQDAVIRAVRWLDEGREVNHLRKWMLTVARNRGRDYRRQAGAELRADLRPEDCDRVAEGDCPAPPPRPLEGLHRAFVALHPVDRRVFQSWIVRVGNPDSMAVDLGVERRLVKVRLCRVRRRFGRHFVHPRTFLP